MTFTISRQTSSTSSQSYGTIAIGSTFKITDVIDVPIKYFQNYAFSPAEGGRKGINRKHLISEAILQVVTLYLLR